MTTIVCVRKNGKVSLGGDGQATLGNCIEKGTVRKVSRVFKNQVLTGFAGSTADAFILRELFEQQLDYHQGILLRAVVDLAKKWRTERSLRRLEAMMIVCDKDQTFLISGSGDIIEPESEVIAIGSGGNFAKSAALALVRNCDLSSEEVVKEALKIAGEIDIYTNNNHIIETLGNDNEK